MSKLEEARDKFIHAALEFQKEAFEELKDIDFNAHSNDVPEPPTETKDCKEGGCSRVIEPFEQRMLAELKELDERTKKLGLFLIDNKPKACSCLEARAMEIQYEAMKTYRSALYERCSLRGLV